MPRRNHNETEPAYLERKARRARRIRTARKVAYGTVIATVAYVASFRGAKDGLRRCRIELTQLLPHPDDNKTEDTPPTE